MSEWKEKRLEELVDINPETLSVKKYKGKIEYIDIASVSMGNLSNYTTYDITVAPSRARRIIKDNDIIFSTVRPNLKSYYFVKCPPKNAICSTGFAVLRVKNGVNSRFIYSLVTENSFIDYLSSVAKGSAYPAVDTKDFKKAKVCIPNLQTQNRIADILSAYDDLIENNNKRIKLLEQIAENLYKEWFVRFRFPGYETTTFKSGIPSNWTIKKLKDFGKIETGKTPSTAKPENYGNAYHFVKTPDMHGNIFVIKTEEMLSEIGNNSQIKKLLPINSIMVSCIGSAGIVAINTKPAHTNQQINSIILDKPYELEWLYFTCKELKGTIQSFGANGATMTNLSKGKFEKLKVYYPTPEIISKFHQMVEPMFSELKSLLTVNENLIEQRDLLLPRLMRGKLEVE